MDFHLPWCGKSALEITNSLKPAQKHLLDGNLRQGHPTSSREPQGVSHPGHGGDGGDINLHFNCIKHPDIAVSGAAPTPRYRQGNRTQGKTLSQRNGRFSDSTSHPTFGWNNYSVLAKPLIPQRLPGVFSPLTEKTKCTLGCRSAGTAHALRSKRQCGKIPFLKQPEQNLLNTLL